MYKVCLTNDDGPLSRGLVALANRLSETVDLTLIVPDGQRSATGKGLTLNRPLRVNEMHQSGNYRIITHDGTPADSVVLAPWFLEKIDLIVSGINAGGNLGYQSLLTSGTVGAAYEATMKGYPAIAVSMEADPQEWFNQAGSAGDFEAASCITRDVVLRVLEHRLPKGIDFLNLNFPSEIGPDAKIVITRPARVRMRNDVDERVDPHGRKYYWFVGVEVEPDPGTDAYVVLHEKNISISPITIDGTTERHLETLAWFMGLKET